MKRNKPLRPIGKKSRRTLILVMDLKKQAEQEGWIHHCEVAPILRERGITRQNCSGPLTFAHSVKASRRGLDPILAKETARCCTTHHYYHLDLQSPTAQAEIVREAIKRRQS